MYEARFPQLNGVLSDGGPSGRVIAREQMPDLGALIQAGF